MLAVAVGLVKGLGKAVGDQQGKLVFSLRSLGSE